MLSADAWNIPPIPVVPPVVYQNRRGPSLAHSTQPARLDRLQAKAAHWLAARFDRSLLTGPPEAFATLSIYRVQMHSFHPSSTPFTDGSSVGGPATGISWAAGVCLGGSVP